MTIIQSVLFPRPEYTVTSARAWLKKHGYKWDGKVDKGKNSSSLHLRFRQRSPAPLEKKGYQMRTKVLQSGIKLVVAYKKSSRRT